MDAAAAHLLDFTKDLDVELLDQIVTIAYDPTHPQRSAANDFLVRMKDHPDMWKRAGGMLESSKNDATKFFGLQVLGDAISTRWKVLPAEQREGIRNYVVGLVLLVPVTSQWSTLNDVFETNSKIMLMALKQTTKSRL